MKRANSLGFTANRLRLLILCFLIVLFLIIVRLILFSWPSSSTSPAALETSITLRSGGKLKNHGKPGSNIHLGGSNNNNKEEHVEVPSWVTEDLPAFTKHNQKSVKDDPPTLSEQFIQDFPANDEDARKVVLQMLNRILDKDNDGGGGSEEEDPEEEEKEDSSSSKNERFTKLMNFFDVKIEETATAEFAQKQEDSPEQQHQQGENNINNNKLVHPWCPEAVSPKMPECFRFELHLGKQQHEEQQEDSKKGTQEEGGGEKLQLVATSRVAASRGVYFMLKNFLNSSVMWGIDRTGITLNKRIFSKIVSSSSSSSHVFKWTQVRGVQQHFRGYENYMHDKEFKKLRGQVQYAHAPLRYEYNLCTFGYTMAWWKWHEYEREIDWMALHGITMPLALVGQEAAWMKLWTSLFPGVSEADVISHFSGPAFWPWHWMGNLRTWAGTISVQYIERRRKLQLRILKRMREFRMHFVLPAFAGHIPEAVGEVIASWYAESLPKERNRHEQQPHSLSDWLTGKFIAKKDGEGGKKKTSEHIHRSALWMGFNSKYSGVLTLHPTHPLFVRISSHFMKIMTEMYGHASFYSADQFNEMPPPNMDGDYLAEASHAVIEGIQRGANPHARWVVQGWLFLHHRQLWGRPQVKAYLDGAGKGNVIVLDLGSDIREMIPFHSGFFGHDYIWCMLHSFGGRRGIFGDMPTVASRMMKAASTVKETSLVGFGLTMEATHHNPALYELACDLMFSHEAFPVGARPSSSSFSSSSSTTTTTTNVYLMLQKWWINFYTPSRFDFTLEDNKNEQDEEEQKYEMSVATALTQTSEKLGPYAHPHDCCPSFSMIPFMPLLYSTGANFAFQQSMNDLDSFYRPHSLFTSSAALLDALSARETSHKRHEQNLHWNKQKGGSAAFHGGGGEQEDPLRYDAVDFTRQVFDTLFSEMHDTFQSILQHCGELAIGPHGPILKNPKDPSKACLLSKQAEEFAHQMIIVIYTMDDLLGTCSNFDLTDMWLGPSLEWADRNDDEGEGDESEEQNIFTLEEFQNQKKKNKKDKLLLENKNKNKKNHPVLDAKTVLFNAKNLIGQWGMYKIGGYPNYAAKSWAGLYRRVYAPRWWFALKHILDELKSGEFRIVAGASFNVRRAVEVHDWRFCSNHTADLPLLRQWTYKKMQHRINQKKNKKNHQGEQEGEQEARSTRGLWRSVHRWLHFESDFFETELPHSPKTSSFAKSTQKEFSKHFERLPPSSCFINLERQVLHRLADFNANPKKESSKKLLLLRQKASWTAPTVITSALCRCLGESCVGFDSLGGLYLDLSSSSSSHYHHNHDEAEEKHEGEEGEKKNPLAALCNKTSSDQQEHQQERVFYARKHSSRQVKNPVHHAHHVPEQEHHKV